MSRERATSSKNLLDRLQSQGTTPVVNPRRGGPEILWQDAPAAVTPATALGYAVLTLLILLVITGVGMLTTGEHTTFIYQQF
jgi:hypothetical protein